MRESSHPVGMKMVSMRWIAALILSSSASISASRVYSAEFPGALGDTPSGGELRVVPAKLGPVEVVLAGAMVEGLALGNAWLAREFPVPYGAGMVVLSPFASMKNLNGWGNFALMSGVAGLGLYDALNHSQEPGRRKARFWATYACVHLIIIPAYLVDYLTGGKGLDGSHPRASTGIDVDPVRGLILLSARY